MVAVHELIRGASAPPAVELARVSHLVLDRVDLRVGRGELVTICGPSGAGKTRLLHLVAGFERPASGEVRVGGRPVRGPGPDRGIVTQRYALFPHLSALDNVAFGLRARERPLAAEWLERVRLGAHARKLPHELSGGMRQRVAIAQALVMRPAVLLMDEPFGALDAAVREELQAMLLELHARERPTVLFVTHDLDEALRLGTRLLVVAGGRIVHDVARAEFDRDVVSGLLRMTAGCGGKPC
jgi:NitT/TauT family transport system ATP-binding protein